MFCTECGTPISDSSKFCPQCGKKQIETISRIPNEEPETPKHIEKTNTKEDSKYIDRQVILKFIGWYLAWILLHLGILLIFSDSITGTDSSSMDKFWPVSKRSDIEDYDYREFLVYTLFPFAAFVIWSMTSSSEENKHPNTP